MRSESNPALKIYNYLTFIFNTHLRSMHIRFKTFEKQQATISATDSEPIYGIRIPTARYSPATTPRHQSVHCTYFVVNVFFNSFFSASSNSVKLAQLMYCLMWTEHGLFSPTELQKHELWSGRGTGLCASSNISAFSNNQPYDSGVNNRLRPLHSAEGEILENISDATVSSIKKQKMTESRRLLWRQHQCQIWWGMWKRKSNDNAKLKDIQMDDRPWCLHRAHLCTQLLWYASLELKRWCC
jgi:hypothetical protein